MTNSKSGVKKGKNLVVLMLDLLKKCFPRSEGYGWKVPKFHCWANMLNYVEKFGSAENFDGGKGERFLKLHVKDLVQLTQKVPSKLVEQISKRKYEQHVIDHAFKYGVVPALHLEEKLPLKPMLLGGRGKYDMHFGEADQYGRGSVTVTWKNRDRENLMLGTHPMLEVIVRKHAIQNGWTGSFDISGYTSYTMQIESASSPTPVTFHANELIHGNSWYDWCMINMASDTETEDLQTCPCLILGFIRYETCNFPSPRTMDGSNDKDLDSIVYAVIHAADDWMTWNTLHGRFVSTFKLGGDDCLYIVDASTIEYALIVVPDNERNICILPYDMWHIFFKKQISII